LSARYTVGPLFVPFVGQKTSSFTLWIGPLIPLTVNRM
jgi:hypothetical protein